MRLRNSPARSRRASLKRAFDSLKRPIQRLTALDMNLPFRLVLEERMYASKNQIIAAVKKLL
jgi:pyruvate/2-oxoglutarate/acetoin dehydrogenase E1 component